MMLQHSHYNNEGQLRVNTEYLKDEEPMSEELIGEVFDSLDAQNFLEKNPNGFAREAGKEYKGGNLSSQTMGLKVGLVHVSAIWEKNTVNGKENRSILGYTLRPMDAIRYFEGKRAA